MGVSKPFTRYRMLHMTVRTLLLARHHFLCALSHSCTPPGTPGKGLEGTTFYNPSCKYYSLEFSSVFAEHAILLSIKAYPSAG